MEPFLLVEPGADSRPDCSRMLIVVVICPTITGMFMLKYVMLCLLVYIISVKTAECLSVMCMCYVPVSVTTTRMAVRHCLICKLLMEYHYTIHYVSDSEGILCCC